MVSKNGTRKIKKTLLELLELPEEILQNLSKVTVIGAEHIGVENHHGIVEYRPDLVRIKINPGELEIWGEDLLLRNLYQDEIIVQGKINKLNFKK